jgi:hypothetical protein
MRWQPQQEIAMACERCAEANEVMPAQLVDCTQQMMLLAKPALMLGNDGRTIAVRADPERIAPFAPAADVDGTCRNA